MSIEVLTKGLYSFPQIRDFVAVREYMFISKGEKRLITVRFCNETSFTVNEICVELYQLDGKGNTLRKTRLTDKGRRVSSGNTFALRELPELDDKCVDIKVRVIYVISGDYRYNTVNGRVTARYIPPKTRPDTSNIHRQHGAGAPQRLLFSLIVVALILGMIGATMVQLVIPLFEELGVFELVAEAVEEVIELVGIGAEKSATEEETKHIYIGDIQKYPVDNIVIETVVFEEFN